MEKNDEISRSKRFQNDFKAEDGKSPVSANNDAENGSKTLKTAKTDEKTFNPEFISWCNRTENSCFCMTHTMDDNTCGKCGAWKGDYSNGK